MSDTHCPFCLENNIIKGEVLHAGEHTYVVESIHPILNLAAMIIPKRHISTPFELSTEEWIEIKETLDITKSLLDQHEPNGYNIGWNIGKTGGQEVDHVHLHVIARFDDEPLAGKGIRYFLKQENNKRNNS